MGDEAMSASIARAQETANQAHDLASKATHDVAQVKERMGEVSQRLTFQEQVFLNHATTQKELESSVTSIKISNAAISNEVKNMGLMGNRLESTINNFVVEMKGKLDAATTSSAENKGSLKTWLVVGGGGFAVFQVLLTAVLAHFFK